MDGIRRKAGFILALEVSFAKSSVGYTTIVGAGLASAI